MNYALFNRIQLSLIQDYVKKVKKNSLFLKLKYVLAVKFYNACKERRTQHKRKRICKNKTKTRDMRSITIIFTLCSRFISLPLHDFCVAHKTSIIHDVFSPIC